MAGLRPREFVRHYGIEQVVCCFSGGKDSLVATHYTMRELGRVQIPKYVVWVDTTIMIPPAREFVEAVCTRYGWSLRILHPQRTFEEFVLEGHRKGSKGWGMPTPRRRWCSFALKLEPIARFCASLPGRVGVVTGLRRWESNRRRNMRQVFYIVRSDSRFGLKPVGTWNYAPILDWTDSQVEAYIARHGLPRPPWYEHGIKETCACGVYMTRRERLALAIHYPEFFKRFVDLEGRFRSGGCAFYSNYRPLSAKEIWRRAHPERTLEDYL
jgi:3'-phosphoadenosine 5'-phosphosulfate sulfotransferase (PAPS reductase)/FAD synthetase